MEESIGDNTVSPDPRLPVGNVGDNRFESNVGRIDFGHFPNSPSPATLSLVTWALYSVKVENCYQGC